MSDIITTLHEKNNPSNKIYPDIKSENIPENAVTTPKLTNNAVTGEKINDGSISTAKIQDGAVTTTKIANGSITGEKIADGSITTNKLGDGAVTTTKIADGSITTNKLGDGSVTPQKMGFHLYEHNIIVANNIDVNEASEVLIFKILTNDGTAFTGRSDIAVLLYERGFDLDKPLMATGRYSDDSFEVVTGIDWGQQSDTTDYCETYIIGVYGTSAEELKAVVCSLSENETTKIYSLEISSPYFHDNVVQLF